MIPSPIWVVFLVFALASVPTFARKGGGYVALDLGAHASNVVGRYNVQEANRNQVSSYKGWFRFRPGIHLGGQYVLETSVALPLPWRSGQDGTTKTFLIQFDLDLMVPLSSWLRWRSGLGLQMDLITSTATAVELNNGTGTSTFFTPAGLSMGAAWTVQTGLNILLSGSIAANFDLFAVSVGSSTRRQLHLAVSLGVHL